MRVLVTGAASFTAGHLVPALAARPGVERVTGTDAAPAGAAGAAHVAADLTRPGEAERALEAAAPTHVVHLAGVSTREPGPCWAVNLDATRRLLEACAARPEPPALLLVSSASVYGLTAPEESPVGEHAPLRPVTSYGASKAAAELLALAMHRRGELAVTVVRPFNLVGPGLRPGFAPSDFVAQACAIRDGRAAPEVRVGDITPRRDFVDVRDAVVAYVALLGRPDLAGRVLNVATGRAVAVRAVLELALAAAGVTAAVVVDPARVRAVDVPEQAGDPGALRAATGWSAAIPLERSIEDMAAAPRPRLMGPERP
jgi:GDP-4-dehydro-6-deoxy-D-mannose reductase